MIVTGILQSSIRRIIELFDPYWEDVTILLRGDDDTGSVAKNDAINGETVNLVYGATQIDTDSVFGSSGCLRFDGNSARATVVEQPIARYENFTIEAWVKVYGANTLGRPHGLWSCNKNSSSGEFDVLMTTSGNVRLRRQSSNGPSMFEQVDFVVDSSEFNHIAHTFDGSHQRIYVNGIKLIEIADTDGIISHDVPFTFGSSIVPSYASYANMLNGVMDEIRVTKGVVRYTDNFTPSNRPHPYPAIDPYWEDVSLLLKMDGANGTNTFIDSSSNNVPMSTTGDLVMSSSQSISGDTSAYFNGGSGYADRGYVYNTTTNAHSFTSGDDFTVEMFVYPDYVGGTRDMIITDTRSGTDDTTGASFFIRKTGVPSMFAFPSSYDFGDTVPEGQWSHLAFVRVGGVISAYINGVEAPNTYSLGSKFTNNRLCIGANINVQTNNSVVAQWLTTGYIDEFRITKGVARYQTNFTPQYKAFPTSAPLPDILYVDMNGANQSQTFSDTSSNAFPITVIGNTHVTNDQMVDGKNTAFFDGSGDYLQLSSTMGNTIAAASEFHIRVKVFIESFGASRIIFSQSLTGGDSTQSLYVLSDGKVRFYRGSAFGASQAVNVTTPNAIPLSQWVDVVVSWDGTAYSIYVDDSLEVTVNNAYGWQSTTYPVYIGRNLIPSVPSETLFTGYMSQLAIESGTYDV